MSISWLFWALLEKCGGWMCLWEQEWGYPLTICTTGRASHGTRKTLKIWCGIVSGIGFIRILWKYFHLVTTFCIVTTIPSCFFLITGTLLCKKNYHWKLNFLKRISINLQKVLYYLVIFESTDIPRTASEDTQPVHRGGWNQEKKHISMAQGILIYFSFSYEIKECETGSRAGFISLTMTVL